MNCYMGIDLGTSGTKTVLFGEAFQILASASEEYPLFQPQNGWAEQDPGDWWNAVLHTVTAVLNQSGVLPGEVKGIGLSGQMHGLVMLDQNGCVLRPAILWCDQRTAKQCDQIIELVGREKLIEITANPALTGFTASKILWVREHEPDLYQACAHILLPKDYIRYKLTGEFATEVSDASGMQLLDVPRRCWSLPLLDRLSIDPKLLAEVYESPEVTGTVTSTAAAQSGLAVGTPVVGGAGDNAAAAVGTGVVADGKAFATIGTSGVVYAHTSQPKIDPEGRVHTFCCAVPGCWHVMGVTQAAGLSLKWFKDQFCTEEIHTAQNLGTDPYVLLDKEAALSPVGSNRLIYLPYLMGERTPHLNPDCRGVFFGLSAMHQKRDLLRAVMEGVTFSQRDSLQILEEMNIHLSEILACGGGGSSPFWRQLLADILNLPVRTTVSKEGPALGVAILASVGTGQYASVQEACNRFCQTNAPCMPNAEIAAQYTPYYKLYQDLYPALQKSFQQLSGI